MNTDTVLVRDLSEDDIPHILNYWFHSPPGFVEAMGVDLAKLPRESDMEKNLREKVNENKMAHSSKLNALVILCNGQPVGFHTLFPISEGDFGIFHAHIWNPSFRRRGLGLKSYPMACKVFLERFELKRILFKTPTQNIGAIRLKERLGIRCLGEEAIGFGIIKENTLSKVFELRRDELATMLGC